MGADRLKGTYAAGVFDPSRPYGGPMQLARAWAVYFSLPWEQIVFDLAVHFRAARAVYDLAGDWSPWPVCGAFRKTALLPILTTWTAKSSSKPG